MDTALLPSLSRLLVHHDKTYGSDGLAADFVLALISTIDQYTGDDSPRSLQGAVLDLYSLILACRPRMANLIFDLQEVLIHTIEHSQFSKDSIRGRLLELLGLKRSRRQETVKHALTRLSGVSRIFLHSHSSTLNMLLTELSKRGEKPEIILAAQSSRKTEQMIRHLQICKFDYRVVSEYAIAHVIEGVDLALFGGMTLTNDMQVLMGPGSASLITQLRAIGIPSYVLLTTNKFSYWEEQTAPAYKEAKTKPLDSFTYTHEIYSHDILPVELIEGIICDRGIYNPSEAEALFRSLQKDYLEKEAKVKALYPEKSKGDQKRLRLKSL